MIHPAVFIWAALQRWNSLFHVLERSIRLHKHSFTTAKVTVLEAKAYTFKSITSCLLFHLCICSYSHQASKKCPAFSALSWKHNLSANYRRNYCTWAGYNGLRTNKKKSKRGVYQKKETTLTGDWSNFSDNPLTHCCGSMGQKRTTGEGKGKSA